MIVPLLIVQAWAVAVEIKLEGFEKWTSDLPTLLSRRWNAVVETRVDGRSGFEVTRSFSGPLSPGRKLPFDQCSQILVMGSTPAFLDRATRTAPVLDVPRPSVSRLNLPSDRTLRSYAPPRRDARYFMILRWAQGQPWGFLNQTLGDFFLIQEGKVFQLGYAYEGQSVPSVWAPILPTVGAADFELALRREIAKHRGAPRP